LAEILKILVGIGHQADVHFFRHFIAEMKGRGHEVFVVAREKEITCYLLKHFRIPFYHVSVHQGSVGRKIVDYFIRWFRTYRLCRKIRPDIALGVGDFYLPQVGSVLGFTSVVITDTEAAFFDSFLTFPFASHVLVPTCYQKKIRRKVIKYNSYNALAYLGDDHFVPDKGIYRRLGLEPGQRYVVLRFVGKTAVHDFGSRSIGYETRLRAVRAFSKYGQVFISSEKELSGELKAWQLPCAPEDIHHVIYYADLLFGDSATMASEAACLGTPAIFVDDQGRGYTDEQERKYGLVFNFGTSAAEQGKAVDRAVEILKGVWGSREEWSL
jgi:hypothetical protein